MALEDWRAASWGVKAGCCVVALGVRGWGWVVVGAAYHSADIQEVGAGMGCED